MALPGLNERRRGVFGRWPRVGLLYGRIARLRIARLCITRLRIAQVPESVVGVFSPDWIVGCRAAGTWKSGGMKGLNVIRTRKNEIRKGRI